MNASIKRASHIARDAAPDKNDMRNAATNRTILESGRFVFLRMARGTGSGGTVTKMDGIPNINVMTDKTTQQVTRDFDGGVTFCKASTDASELKITGGRIRPVATTIDKREKILKDFERLCFSIPG